MTNSPEGCSAESCDATKRQASKILFGDPAWLDRADMAEQMDDGFVEDNGSRSRRITPNQLIAELNARTGDVAQPTLRCPACASANVSRNPNGWFDCRYCNKMGSEEEFASQPSPAATVETLSPEQWVDKLREGTEFAETPLSRSSAGNETELLATLVYEAMRFAIWAAGQGMMPDEGEPALGPEDFLYEYSCALEIDDWEGLAEVARDHIRAVPQAVAWPPISLGDTVYMNERSPYFHDWKGVSLKVVSLRIDPDGKPWVSVIEGEQRHRGNGVYDAETTDIDAEHLSPLSRPPSQCADATSQHPSQLLGTKK